MRVNESLFGLITHNYYLQEREHPVKIKLLVDPKLRRCAVGREDPLLETPEKHSQRRDQVRVLIKMGTSPRWAISNQEQCIRKSIPAKHLELIQLRSVAGLLPQQRVRALVDGRPSKRPVWPRIIHTAQHLSVAPSTSRRHRSCL